MRPGDPSYNILSAFRIRCGLSPKSLEAAWKRLLIRHAALRSRIISDAEGRTTQIIEGPAPFTLEMFERLGLTEEHQRDAIEDVFEEETSRSFDLARNMPRRLSIPVNRRASTGCHSALGNDINTIPFARALARIFEQSSSMKDDLGTGTFERASG